jgi:hypothetical protein
VDRQGLRFSGSSEVSVSEFPFPRGFVQTLPFSFPSAYLTCAPRMPNLLLHETCGIIPRTLPRDFPGQAIGGKRTRSLPPPRDALKWGTAGVKTLRRLGFTELRVVRTVGCTRNRPPPRPPNQSQPCQSCNQTGKVYLGKARLRSFDKFWGKFLWKRFGSGMTPGESNSKRLFEQDRPA